MRAEGKHFRTICEQTFDNSLLSPIHHLWIGDHPWKVWRLCIIARFSCLPICKTFPSMSSRPRDNICVGFLPAKWLFDSGCRDQRFDQVFLFSRFWNSARILAAYTPSTIDLTEISVLRDQLISSICPTWVSDCPSFHSFFMSSTWTERNKPFLRCMNNTFPVWNFLQFVFYQDLLKWSFPQQSWWWCPYTFLSRRTLGSWISSHYFGRRNLGRRIQIAWHSDADNSNNVGVSSIFTWVWADTALLACPAHPESLEMASRTLAAVMCHAEDPCSVNTAHEPESLFTTSPRSATRPLCVWLCFPILRFWSGTLPWALQNEPFCLLALLHRSPLVCFLTCHSCHAGTFISLSNYLSYAAFSHGIFSAWCTTISQCTRFQWLVEFTPSPSPFGNVIFVSGMRSLVNSWASHLYAQNSFAFFLVVVIAKDLSLPVFIATFFLLILWRLQGLISWALS